MADSPAPWEPRWLGRLSHDLRNELVPLRTATDLLALGRLEPDRQREMVAMIERQTRRLVRMLDDVSEYGRLLSGATAPASEPVDLALVVDNAVGAIDARLRGAGHTLDLRLSDAPAQVRGDARRLTQLLQRLLDNAIRFTPQGGRLTLTLSVSQDQASLDVADSGPGIAEERFESIFSPPLEQRESDGLGISLMLARAWARDHGGELVALPASADGGARFRLRLPLAQD